MPDTDQKQEMTAEEAAMLSDWEKMSDGAEGGAASADDGFGDDDVGQSRVLNQDEIDSLLGFDDSDGRHDRNGVMALVNAALVNYERLPMLDIVFDRLVRLMSTTLRNLTNDNVEVSLDQISTVRFGDYLNSIPLPAMLSVFKAEEWDNSGLLTVDSALIYSVVDVLLGGRKGIPAVRIEGRPYTTIETKLVERLVNTCLGDMSSAFDPLSPVTFRLDRMETNPRFATITQSNNACIAVRLRVDMGDRGGRIEILLPHATLEPIRNLLLQMFMGEKFGRDSIWETHLTKELLKTDVQLSAILAEDSIMLREILKWKPGTQIWFNTTVNDPIEIRCGHLPLFVAHSGHKQGMLAAQIEKYIPPKKEEEEE